MKQTVGIALVKENHLVWTTNDDHCRFLEREGFTNLGIKSQKEVKALVKDRGYKLQYQF